MPVSIRRGEPAPSVAEPVRGNGRLGAARWSNPAPGVRPHRRVARLAEVRSVRDGGARLFGYRWRAASVINIQPLTTSISPHSISAGIAGDVQIRSYLLRSGSLHRPLWTAFLRLEPPTVFHHASLEPFPDQADDSLIPHPMFPKLDQPIVLEL